MVYGLASGYSGTLWDFFINDIFGSNYCMSVYYAQLPVSCWHLKLLLTITYVVFSYDYFIILCGV